jgi:hypothetical protein
MRGFAAKAMHLLEHLVADEPPPAQERQAEVKPRIVEKVLNARIHGERVSRKHISRCET